MTTLHEKAKFSLKDEFLTTELLNESDENNNTVWHFAAQHNTLKDIPIHLFTEDDFNQKSVFGYTVWDIANNRQSLLNIEKLPKVFYEKTFLFHHAAATNKLKYVPLSYFTHEALNRKDKEGLSVWRRASENGTLEDIPKHLITADLLELFEDGQPVISRSIDRDYINHVLTMPDRLMKLFKKFPRLEKEVEFRDERLILDDVRGNRAIFKVCSEWNEPVVVVLWERGVSVTSYPENHKTLNQAVSFIEKTYHHVEQSISLPKNNVIVQPFVL